MGYRFDFGVVLKLVPFILKGVEYTLLISASAFTFGCIVGMLVAVLRLTRIRLLDALLSVYVDVFRTVPVLVVLFWFYYALPMLTGFQVSAVIAGSVALGIACSAGLSEIFRGGILSVSKGQWEAGFALGMTTLNAYRRVVLPQAIVRMIPPLASSVISMIKESSLASAIGVAELMWQGEMTIVWTYRRVEVYTVIAIMYFALTYPQAILVGLLHERLLPKE